MNPPTNKKAALDYLLRGWSVIPVRPRDKRPAIRWLEFQQRLASMKEIRSWFTRWPDANVGIVTGSLSGLIVIDIDPKHGGDQSLAVLEERHGSLPNTVESLTGGGGRHIYFAHPGGIIHNQAGLAPGIDLRGDGGYAVAPPSIHSSGRQYVWIPSHEPNTTKLALMPDWLLTEVDASYRQIGHPMSYWRQLVKEGVPQGQRNNTMASLAGHLLWHGIDPEVAMEMLLCWNRVRCRPPLSDDEVIHTVESITRLHQDDKT